MCIRDRYERLQLIKEIIENINYPKEISDYDFNILYTFNQINNFAFNNTDLIALIKMCIRDSLQLIWRSINQFLFSTIHEDYNIHKL